MAIEPIFELNRQNILPGEQQMNMYANGKGAGIAEMEDEWETPETAHYTNPEFEDEWETPEVSQYSNSYSNPEFEGEWEMQEAAHYSNPEMAMEWEDEGEYFFKSALRGIKKVAKAAIPLAKRFAPSVAKALLGAAIPGAGAVAGPLAGKLVGALLQEGEMEAAQMEAQFFGTNEAEAEVSNTEAAYEAALTEVLAAEASHTQNEAEAEALMGAALPSAVKSMGGRRALRSIMPVLVHANARLVRLLHRRGSTGRQLLRLVPTIMRRTVASLRAAQRAGRPINGALATQVMAAQAARVLGNSKILTSAMICNAIIRQRTVAPGRPMSYPAQSNEQEEIKAMQNETLFETPASHEASMYSNPYSNSEFENEWENPKSQYSNSEFEHEWEMQEASQYSNPYSNPEFEDEGEFFFNNLGKGLKSIATVAAPLAKQIAPIAARTLFNMIPGVGPVAGPLAGKLTSVLLQEAEMEVAQMEAALFGTNEFEAEVGQTETAHEAALTEVLAAQAAEATNEAEAEAAVSAALPITISIMGGQRPLRSVTPILAQANGRLVKVLGRQGATGRQLLRAVPAIQRQTVATLKAAARSGKPINGPMAVRAMAAATQRVLSNPRTVQRAIQRNVVLRQRTAPPHPRRVGTPGATRCPVCAPQVARR